MSITLIAIKNLFSRPFTRRYPKEKVEPLGHFRGVVEYYPEKCIGCRMCERYCPSDAITFHEKGKIDFDMGKCVFCGLCADVCPADAITITKKFEMADKDKTKFIVR
jgi:formate hydrogenlyase subunit 6